MIRLGQWQISTDVSGNLLFSIGGQQGKGFVLSPEGNISGSNTPLTLTSVGSINGQRPVTDGSAIRICSPNLQNSYLNGTTHNNFGAQGEVAAAYWMSNPDQDSDLIIQTK